MINQRYIDDTYFAPDVLLDKQVLALVVEDNMDLLGAGTTDVWPKHDIVWGLAMHVLLVQCGGEDLGIATSAVNVLLMLHCELDNKGLVLVTELVKLGRDTVETGILGSLQT